MFFIKECKRTLHAFWFHKSYKNDKSCKKKNLKERSVFYKVKKELNVLFQYIFIYIYLYISIYIYIYIYIYLYIFIYISIYIYCKKKGTFSRSFTFFAKECCVLCVLLRSLQKNVAFFAFFYVLCKRMLRSLRSFGSHKSPKTRKKNVKERCVL